MHGSFFLRLHVHVPPEVVRNRKGWTVKEGVMGGPFLHPDGGRTDTYLIEYGGDYFPIKRSTLHTCLDPEQRVQARV